MRSAALELALLAVCLSRVCAQVIGTAQTPPSSTISAPFTILTGCHLHGLTQFCIAPDNVEYEILTTSTDTAPPAQYTGCHSHENKKFCVDPSGKDIEVHAEESKEEPGAHQDGQPSSGTEKKNCHFHAGVEHCVGDDSSETGCGLEERSYNIPIRIGSIFGVLVASAIAVFIPILLTSLTRLTTNNIIFIAIKQFGTGVIIATAFVHLYTHADLMFQNKCIGTLAYESTTAAIVMAGLLIAFITEYIGSRIVQWTSKKNTRQDQPIPAVEESGSTSSNEKVSNEDDPLAKLQVVVMEAGIIFHSILIGLTLVVADDSMFKTLLVVIIFHQMFEGLALGTRIAALPSPDSANPPAYPTSFLTKFILGVAFSLITPVGMAIGIGVIHNFNGNDRTTIITLGTLDALSAGILAWVGLVEMLGEDWFHGVMAKASPLMAIVGLICLVVGMALMSFLGKWA